MSLHLHSVQSAKGSNKRKKRLGRGWSSGSGKYSGRGTKGQKARAGSSGFIARGMKRLILSTPKLRGFKSVQPNTSVVNLQDLEKYFDAKMPVTVKSLKKTGLVSANDKKIKILGKGQIKTALQIKGVSVSASARKKILASGGSVE